MSGLDSTGLAIDTIDDIATAMATDVKNQINQAIDTGPTSVMGLLIGIVAERVYALQLGLRDIYQAYTPGGAAGQALTQLAMLTGTIRNAATKSLVTATVNLNAGATLPAGSQARVPGTTVPFASIVDVTNSGGAPANVTVVMQATSAGAVRANAGTLTEIATPVAGWNSVTNATDASIGLDDEADTALRLRRETELRVSGSGNVDAIAAAVKEVSGVVDALVDENTTDSTVGALTPHSFRVTIWDGASPAAANDAVAQAIWNKRAPASTAIGGTTGTATDARGGTRSLAFDRATQEALYLTIDVSINSAIFPSDGDTQITDAVLAYTLAHWTIGQSAILSALYGPIFSVTGVTRVNSIKVGTAPSPSSTSDFAIASNQIAIADSGRISVVHT